MHTLPLEHQQHILQEIRVQNGKFAKYGVKYHTIEAFAKAVYPNLDLSIAPVAESKSSSSHTSIKNGLAAIKTSLVAKLATVVAPQDPTAPAVLENKTPTPVIEQEVKAEVEIEDPEQALVGAPGGPNYSGELPVGAPALNNEEDAPHLDDIEDQDTAAGPERLEDEPAGPEVKSAHNNSIAARLRSAFTRKSVTDGEKEPAATSDTCTITEPETQNTSTTSTGKPRRPNCSIS